MGIGGELATEVGSGALLAQPGWGKARGDGIKCRGSLETHRGHLEVWQ